MFYSKLLLLATIFFCISCHNRIDDKLEQEIIKTLEQNNEMLDNVSSNMNASLKALAEKPETKEKAIYWSARALFADSLLNSFLERTKNKRYSCSYENLTNLFIDYKNKMAVIDLRAGKELKNALAQEAALLNSSNITDLDMCLFENKTIRVRNAFIDWCLKQIGTTGGGYDSFMGIASQNSIHFKPNDSLEIYAGVGQFNSKTQTQVLINNQPIETNFDGIAEYKINVGNKRGKFSKRVSIIFSNFYKQKDTVTKQIFYTVD